MKKTSAAKAVILAKIANLATVAVNAKAMTAKMNATAVVNKPFLNKKTP